MENIKIHKGKNLQENEFCGVYLIRNLDNNLLKIGRCNNLARRFKEITSSFRFCGTSPNLNIECFLEYPYEKDLELYLHEQFDDFREQNEWFKIDNINIILDKLDGFKRKVKEEKVLKVDVEKKKHKKSKPIRVTEEYHYFRFMNWDLSIGIHQDIIWRSKIFNINILTEKITNIIGGSGDPYQIFMFYSGDNLCRYEIEPDEFMLQAFEDENTDCIVEVSKIIEYDEVIIDEDGKIEIVKQREKVYDETFNYYEYIYNDKIKTLYKNIIRYKKAMNIIHNEALDEIRKCCELLGINLLEYLSDENKKLLKMFEAFKNPDLIIGNLHN